MNSTEEEDTTTTKAAGGLEIFADDTGKEVYNAFEKLGSELNTLTENLERQYGDDKDSDIDGITAGLDNINVKRIIAGSAGEPVSDKNIAPNTDSDKKLRHSDSLDNLLDVLDDSIGKESTSPHIIHLSRRPYISDHLSRNFCRFLQMRSRLLWTNAAPALLLFLSPPVPLRRSPPSSTTCASTA